MRMLHRRYQRIGIVVGVTRWVTTTTVEVRDEPIVPPLMETG